jgi:hypothetical protein
MFSSEVMVWGDTELVASIHGLQTNTQIKHLNQIASSEVMVWGDTELVASIHDLHMT